MKNKKVKVEKYKLKFVNGDGFTSVIANEDYYYADNIKCKRLKGKIYLY